MRILGVIVALGAAPGGCICWRAPVANQRWGKCDAAVIALIALFGARPAHADDAEMIANGKVAVAAKLIDPDSARFTDVRVTNKNRQQFVCGRVDAKNRKGEYDGAKPFVFIVADKGSHSAIIYGGRSITDDRLSDLAELAAFNDICGG
jgi:hypothetical protein